MELAGLKAWPGLEAAFDGNWIRRAANGYTKRANSVQSLDPADDGDAPARLEASRRWFETRNLTPVFRSTPLAGPRTMAALDAAGWLPWDHSHLFAMELTSPEPDPRAELLSPTNSGFLAAQQELRGYDAGMLAKLLAIVAAFEVPAIGIVIRTDDGQPAASALMAVADGVVVTGNVVTASAVRRRGFAAAVMRSGLAWAFGAGATTAALNVQAHNAAALGLYASLGYRHQYDYHYRTPPS